MEGKESQKDILRLRQLEQHKPENGSTSSGASSTGQEMQSGSSFSQTFNAMANGHTSEATVTNENN